MTVPPQQRTDSPQYFTRPTTPPYPEDPTTATRHLCAGVYIDETFRNDILREVYYQPRRLVAPSYGFDAVPVLAHAMRARNAAIVRDGLIVATVLFALCFAKAAILIVLSAMIALQLVVATYRLGRDAVRRIRNAEPIGGLTVRALFLLLGWSVGGFLPVFAVITLMGGLSSSYLGGGTDEVVTNLVTTVYGSILLGLLIFAYPTVFSLWRQTELGKMAPGARVTTPVRNSRLDDIGRQQRGNTTIFSGFKPYVGSGSVIETWGFAQRLVRANHPLAQAIDDVRRSYAPPVPNERQREFASPPFEAQELVDYVREHLSALLPWREAEEQIAGLTVEDRVCLAGTEASRLVPYTDPNVMAAVVRFPTTPARHYLACQVFAWGGELITTVYVHIAVQGRSLYLEVTTTALPPCDERFRVVDTMSGHGNRAWFRAFTDGLLETPRIIWRSPLNLAAALINLSAGSAVAAASPDRLTRGFDYGARVGIREIGAEPEMRYLTQMQDVAKYQKLIERRVIASVLDFLDDRDIDTEEYRARANAILNVNGGANNFGQAAYNGPVNAPAAAPGGKA
jgi:hypothetical protein